LTGKKNLIKNKNKISSFIKDNLNLLVDESLSRVVLLKISADELKQSKKKELFESIFSQPFELDEEKKISIKRKLAEIDKNTESLSDMIARSSKLIMTSTTSVIKKAETDIYATMSKIVDRIEKIEKSNNLYALTMICSEEIDNLTISENLLVSKNVDYYNLGVQQAQLQLFVDGILQTNDTADKGDYLLTLDENSNVVVAFHEIVPDGATISIFAVKSR
jgi:hypothetical protein